MNDVQSLISRLGGQLEYREFPNWRSPRPTAQATVETPRAANQSVSPARSTLLADYAKTANDGRDPVRARRLPLAEVFASLERPAL